MKMGGEYFRFQTDFRWCNRCMGDINARMGPAPAQSPVAVPGLERCVHLESRAARAADVAGLSCRLGHRAPLQHRSSPGCRMGAGRLADGRPYDAEPRRAVRLGFQRTFRKVGAPSVPAWRSAARHQQRRAARGDEFPPQRSDGAARRMGTVLRVLAQRRCAAELFDGAPLRIPDRQQRQSRPSSRTGSGQGASGEGEFGGPRPSWEASLARACDINNAPGVYPAGDRAGDQLSRPPDAI